MAPPRLAVVMPTYVTESWQWAMTKAAIETLRVTSAGDLPIIVANRSGAFEHEWGAIECGFTDIRVIRIPSQGSRSVNHDSNIGFEAAEKMGAEFIVYTGNDVFTRPGWLPALLACFGHDPRCEIATLMPAENRPHLPNLSGITEGVYGPFMMFRAHRRFDADEFPGVFGDTDLMMRVYREGGLALRNNDHTVYHFLHQTAIFGPEAYAAARAKFVARHSGCGLLMYRLLAEGGMF